MEKILLTTLIEDLKRFLESRERREEWIPIDTPLNKVNWSSLTDNLPDNITVGCIEEFVEEWEQERLKTGICVDCWKD